MKYIITQLGGKQYLFKVNEYYNVILNNKLKINSYLFLNKILFFKNNLKFQIGKPFLLNSKILAKIVKKKFNKKITILKTKPKKKYTRIKGYKSLNTQIYIL